MHELSITQDIVATVIRHLPPENRAPVRWVRLQRWRAQSFYQ